MKYSIITINYNHHDGLKKTIESVIIQSCKDYEFIIIDGGSTDGSREVIEQFSVHINYWVSEPDKGIYNAMNKGIKAANGEYLIFMNSGDTFYNERALESSLPFLKYDIVQGITKNQDKTETPLCLVQIPGKTQLFSPSLHHQSCFFNKKLFNNFLYDENYKIVSDWKFYIEQVIFHDCTYSYMPIKVAIYEGGGISDYQKEIEFDERIDIIKKITKLLKERGAFCTYKEIIMHLMFTTKQRLLLNNSFRDINKYIEIFPEANSYYKFYPFSPKIHFLFFLAEHRLKFLIKVIFLINQHL